MIPSRFTLTSIPHTGCWVLVASGVVLAGWDGEVLGLVYCADSDERRSDGFGTEPFLVRAPMALADGVRAPLVFVLHGAGQSTHPVRALRSIDVMADWEVWIAALPKALDGAWATAEHGDAVSFGVDDVDPADDMPDQILHDLAVDPRHVYPTGLTCVVDGGRHAWPASPFDLTAVVGADMRDISATEISSEFLTVH